MSMDAQPAPSSASQTLLNGSLTLSHEDREVRNLASAASRIETSSSPLGLPVDRGKSSVLQLRHRGTNNSATSVASAMPRPVVDEANRSKRVLLTHVFTDIVASTETLEQIGDRAWGALLLRHHHIVRELLKACHGREIDAAGDGFFLVFDRPSRAVHFAIAVRTALKGIGIDLRIGIHTGECELVCGRVLGVAVHTAARIVNAAAAGDILVSSTVRDLLAGSEHRFSKEDERVLKGLSEPRQLFALKGPQGNA